MFKLASVAAAAAVTGATYAEGSLRDQFENFVIEHGKTYSSETEKAERFEIFRKNMEHINNLNIQFDDMEFGITQFADMTLEERNSHLTGGLMVPDSVNQIVLPEPGLTDELVADSVSYKDCYPAARNQGNCGSCWAFSTAHAVEGAYCKATGQAYTVLSPQSLVDCDNNQGGCRGASTLTEPLEWVQKNGICTEEEYPYKGRDGSCAISECTNPVKIDGIVDVSGMTDVQIANALVKYGPLSVGIDATMLMFYKFGVLNKWTCLGTSQMNHAVTLVGFKKNRKGQLVFDVMNSWGKLWGKKGHFKVKYGACGFGKIAVAAVLNSAAAEERM